jgi:hypothetical protein
MAFDPRLATPAVGALIAALGAAMRTWTERLAGCSANELRVDMLRAASRHRQRLCKAQTALVDVRTAPLLGSFAPQRPNYP